MAARNSGNLPKAAASSSKMVVAARGAILGWFFGLALHNMSRGVLPWLGSDYVILVCPLLWGALAGTRLRAALWWPPGILAILMGVVGFTPVMSVLMPRLVLAEPPRKADAVIVLASDVFLDGGMTCAAQSRMVKAYELLSAGYAPRMILSHGSSKFADWSAAAREQMRQLHFTFPVLLTRHAENTHQEAQAVARLARQHGWTRFLLVTHPWHMRRAVAVFRQAGVRVVPVPCEEQSYDFNALAGFGDRVAAFRDWAHETLGYWVYMRRGWI
ncbi:MAG: YdcF family protein [Chthonomonadales bacterium]